MKRVSSMWHVIFKGDDPRSFVFLYKALREGVLDAVFRHVGKDGKDPHYHCLLRFKKPIDFEVYCPSSFFAEPCHSRKAFVFYGANERETFV